MAPTICLCPPRVCMRCIGNCGTLLLVFGSTYTYLYSVFHCENCMRRWRKIKWVYCSDTLYCAEWNMLWTMCLCVCVRLFVQKQISDRSVWKFIECHYMRIYIMIVWSYNGSDAISTNNIIKPRNVQHYRSVPYYNNL